MGNSKNGKKFYSYFAFVVYEEDDKELDLYDRLFALRMPSLISPLHDKDVKEDGTPKKPHRHVMVKLPYSYEETHRVGDMPTNSRANSLFADIMGGGSGVLVSNHIAMTRYFCHLDEPLEVPRYSKTGYVALGGWLLSYSEDKELVRNEALDWVENYIFDCQEGTEEDLQNLSYWKIFRDCPAKFKPYIRGYANHIKNLIYS